MIRLRWRRRVETAILNGWLFFGAAISSAQDDLSVPEGFEISVEAKAPLVSYPMMGCFDHQGRLYLAESAGHNWNEIRLGEERPNFIRMLEDTDGDGVFDRSTIFADKLALPNGALWHNGSLYVAEMPGIWRFTDTDGDGVADQREHIAGNVRSNGMSSTLHGPMLHPSGRLFWCGGQQGFVFDKDAEIPEGRMVPGTFWMKADGSEHEQFAAGGLANPVEVTFSPEGDVFGTVAILERPEQTRYDALMHWVYGGVYHYRPGTPLGLQSTGPELPPLSRVGQVAPAGVVRYRGNAFGEDYRDSIFWAQFNTHHVLCSKLTRQGSSYQSEDRVFLSSTDVDSHFTDVIEDADGSLLVIDTGGWFRHGCPTSQIARPEIKGRILRIRRSGVSPANDPRGLEREWNAAPVDLVTGLDDSRPVVRERTMEALTNLGNDAMYALDAVLNDPDSTVRARRNAVWTLVRIGSPATLSLVRQGLKDTSDSVRQAAAMSLGIDRDSLALQLLLNLVETDSSGAVRREAAFALSRIEDSKAVPVLLRSFESSADPFLDHALVLALMRIGDPKLTLAGLDSDSAATRRGALLALGRMKGFQAGSDQLQPHLFSKDPEVAEAAFELASRNPDLRNLASEILLERIPQATGSEIDLLATAALAILGNGGSRLESGAELINRCQSEPARRAILEILDRLPIKRNPAAWLEGLGTWLEGSDEALQLRIIDVVRQRKIPDLDGRLQRLADEESVDTEVRLAALSAVAPRWKQVEAPVFDFLIESLTEADRPALRLAAARTLENAPLSALQLASLAKQLPNLDSLTLPACIGAFESRAAQAETVGLAFVEGLSDCDTHTLPGFELARLLGEYPDAIQAAGQLLLDKLGVDPAEQKRRLDEFSALLKGGDFARGKSVFFGPKANCGMCHRVHGVGGNIGPNLSTIGQIREGRDLLESILYPSASIVQSFETFSVTMKDGQSHAGVVSRRDAEQIGLRSIDLAEHLLPVAEIEEMREIPVSLMPAGLDVALTRDELRNLLKYLQNLKPIKSYQLDED